MRSVRFRQDTSHDVAGERRVRRGWSIAFLPLAIVGFVVVAYKQMVVSKRLGVSQTMVEVLNARWTMHVFELSPGPP